MRVIGSVWTMLLVTTTVLSAQTITQEPTNQAVLAGGTVVFNVAVSGTGPFTYQWQCNGTNIPNNLITTVAGNGTNGLYGDGGVATNAGVPYPTGVAVDQTGNLFISEALSCRVRKVNTNGIITTIAGTGVSGSSGDGGLATNAQMRRPYGLALDAAGNLYIADTNSCCVRKVDTNGIITTAAGTAGTSNFSGDGGLATSAKISGAYGIAADRSGDLFIADLKNYRIRKVDTNGIINTVAGCGLTYKFTNDVAATNCMLPFPISVAVDHLGQLFIGEWFAQRIRKVDTNGIITVLAGTNTGIFSGKGGYSGDNGPATNAALYNPTGLAVDPSGNVFIADGENHRIRMVDTNGIITTVVGKGKIGYSGDGGTATNARLSNTYIIGLFDVAIDAAGNLFIADFGNHRVRKVWFGGSPTLILNDVSAANAGDYQVIITGAFGSITSSVVTLTVTQPPSILNQPRSQTVFPGNSASFNVAAFGASPLSYQWQKDGSNLAEGDNISGSTSTNLILTAATTGDAGGYSVVVTNAYGSVTSRVSTLAIVPAGCSIIVNPSSLSVWQGSNATLTSSFVGAGAVTYQWQHDGTNIPSQIITTVAGTGTNGFSGDGGPATNASLNYPEGLAVDSSGNLYIADSGNHRLRKMDLDNVITTVAGNGGSGVSGDGGAATNAGLKQPYGIGVDASGDLFISEKYNYVVRKVSTGGIITTVAGNGTSYSDYFDDILATNSHLDYPAGLAVDVAGNLFVADNGNDRVRKVDTDGYISTVAGGGSGGVGGAATNASLSDPNDVAVDAAGNLFIADFRNNWIRKVDANGILSNIAYCNYPSWVTLDASGGLFITSSSQVFEMDSNGTITALAGNLYLSGFSGDGGPAINASFNDPNGVAADANANLYIADTYNHRIRKVGLNGSPVLPLNGANTNNAGNYTLIINGSFGSITSSVVTLTVLIPPAITGIMPGTDGSVTLHFTGGANQNYLLQAATNLVAPVVWQTLSTNAADANGIWQFADTNTSAYPARFYRAAAP